MKLELRDIRCGYDGSDVVQGVSLSIAPGDIACLLGPNGSGKTTLFKAMLGLMPLRCGSVLLDGQDIRRWHRRDIAQKLGYIPQHHMRPFPFTVLDMVLMGRTSRIGACSSPGRADRRAAKEALAALHMRHLEKRIFTELSGGERQLVLIARALAQQPGILIMDEPTANLDFGNQLLVLDHVRELSHGGLSVIMSTHLPNHAFLFGTQVLLLKKGRLLSAGTPEETVDKDTMRSLYNVDVEIVEMHLQDNSEIRVCVPLSHCTCSERRRKKISALEET